MQRFAIKIDKSVKARLKNLCRLCGIDNPNQIDILNAAEWIDLTIDGEVSISRKIEECVGVKVMKNDKMPQRICALCVDKINDFYEFREMCQATNTQTRKLLNLPEPKQPKKFTIMPGAEEVESIFGVVGDDVKPKIEPPLKPAKKSKKATTSSTVTLANENRFRGMTKREIEITLELDRIKKEEEEEQKSLKNEQSRTKNGKKKKKSEKTDGLLLAPKEPNQRERKREIEQKRNEKKRKIELKAKPPSVKKIKKEPAVPCLVCGEVFEKISARDAHMVSIHRPTLSEYGCSSCLESFATMEETVSHNEWHTLFNVPFKCVLCAITFNKLITFQRHVSACVHPSYSAMTSYSSSIHCDICSRDYETQHLYDWHDCFVGHNTPCSKCGRNFNKKIVLMKHFFKCDNISAVPGIVQLSKPAKPKKRKAPTKKKIGRKASVQNSVKLEPETIIEEVDDVFDAVDNNYMDTHFGDSDNEYDENDSIINSTEPNLSNITNASDSNAPSIAMARKSTTCITSNPSIRTNLSQPLPECRVKLEPLDISSFVTSSITINTAPTEEVSAPTVPPLVISRPIVPPLTIRIKKEVIQPGYGDEFDAELARNVKRERVDETWELASTSTASHEHSQGEKKSKHRDKMKKMYKKPAMLAMKIKQERMERDENESEYYPDYSIPSEDGLNDNLPISPFESTLLPIITQIHSILEPIASSSTTMTQATNEQSPNASMSPDTNSIPFLPIRIKSESITPPPENCIDSNEQFSDDNQVTTNLSPHTDNVETSDHLENVNVSHLTDNLEALKHSDHVNTSQRTDAEQQHENQQMESQTESMGKESQNNECDTNVSLNGNDEANLQSSTLTEPNVQTEDNDNFIEFSDNQLSLETVDAAGNPETVSSSTEIASDTNSPESISERNSITYQNEILPHRESLYENTTINEVSSNDEVLNSSQIVASKIHFNSLQMPISGDHLENKNDDTNDACVNDSSNEMVSNENDVNVDSNTSNPIDQVEPLKDDSNEIEGSEKIEQDFIKPICGDELDSVVSSDIFLPIDFCDQNVNDESLNFIDQLVHEVADTMIPPVNNINSLNEEYHTDCPNESVENVIKLNDESALRVAEAIESHLTNEQIPTISDIPEINYSDLLPDLNVSASKSNGNEINTDTQTDENEMTTTTETTLTHECNHSKLS